MTPRVLILAGSATQAAYIAKQRGIRANAWVYLSRAEQLYGIERGTFVWRYGTWYARMDASAINALIRDRGCNVVDVKD